MLRPFRIMCPTASTAFATCTRPIRRAIRITPARLRCRRCGYETRRIVNKQIVRNYPHAQQRVRRHRRHPTEYYPAALRGEIDRINELVYADIDDGVYRCGFARSQAAYEASYDALFAAPEELEARLRRQRYLVGRRITKAAGGGFPRWCVSTSPTFRCSSAIAIVSPIFQTVEIHARALPGAGHRQTVKPRYYVINYYLDRARRSERRHPQGHAGRLPAAARPHALCSVTKL